jgi:rhodanese-related sulfurtransferase
MFFVLGLFAGIFVFGESIDGLLSDFWNSSYMGRFTLPELFGLPVGVVVLAIVVMAVFLFWVVEKVEVMLGGETLNKAHTKYKLVGAGVLIAAAVAVLMIGQPTSLDKWQHMAGQKQPLLDNREVQIHPAELLDYIDNDQVDVVMLDVRNESDYNLFHIQDAQLVATEELAQLVKPLLQKPSNTLFVVMSNDEESATEAWKILVAESLTNVYILEGGLNYWLDTFNIEPDEAGPIAVAMLPTLKPGVPSGNDILRYNFPAALGAQYPAAAPDLHEFEIEYVPKVELEVKKVSGGG